MGKELLFALDIGTRSVVGLVGELTADNTINLLAAERQEHNTRAMLDGQIHNVPEVARILAQVKTRLEKKFGSLKKVSIAAAGRALCTINATAETDAIGGDLLDVEDIRRIELSAVQAAQLKLASSAQVSDPTSYFCVGYSVVQYILDGIKLKSLVGQRGKKAAVEVIATFLPRQVIDSLYAAVKSVDLEIATLTLEPIAAINVLIPQTMRHLNLALIDVGAGTSDIAITKDGSVVGYGMVPFAGDEITEAISEHYLLDFNAAETVKRQLHGKTKKISCQDVLGAVQKISSSDIIAAITPKVGELAEAIARQILAINQSPPQAVLLVGGGSMTPLLPNILAEILGLPQNRVAIRRPDNAEGITNIPASLNMPDAVTPLGILKLAAGQALSFVNVSVNGRPIHLFNFGKLTVADAALAAGLDIGRLNGKPGFGITLTINGQMRFFPGSHGTPGCITLNGQPAQLTAAVKEGDVIEFIYGNDGKPPVLSVADVLDDIKPLALIINEAQRIVKPIVTINGRPADLTAKLCDRDMIQYRLPLTLSEALAAAGINPKPVTFTYIINGSKREFSVPVQIYLNGQQADLNSPVGDQDTVSVGKPSAPTLREILGLKNTKQHISITFNSAAHIVPTQRIAATVNGRPAEPNDTVPDSALIEYSCYELNPPNISDVLLAVNFDPRTLPPMSQFSILLNGQPAEYTTAVKNGDSIQIVVE